MSIGVLLVDDQALVRSGFRMVLEAEDDIEVVGEAANGRQAIDGAHRLKPDVVLMDVRMPELDGIAATREIAGERSAPPGVLILTTFDLDEYVYRRAARGRERLPAQGRSAGAARRADPGRRGRGGAAAPAVTRRLIEDFSRARPAGSAGPPGARRADPRDRGPRADRARALERGDRRVARRRRDHGQDPRRARADEARAPRPRPGGRARLRVRARRPAARQPTPGDGHPPRGRRRNRPAGRPEIVTQADDRRGLRREPWSRQEATRPALRTPTKERPWHTQDR